LHLRPAWDHQRAPLPRSRTSSVESVASSEAKNPLAGFALTGGGADVVLLAAAAAVTTTRTVAG